MTYSGDFCETSILRNLIYSLPQAYKLFTNIQIYSDFTEA